MGPFRGSPTTSGTKTEVQKYQGSRRFTQNTHIPCPPDRAVCCFSGRKPRGTGVTEDSLTEGQGGRPWNRTVILHLRSHLIKKRRWEGPSDASHSLFFPLPKHTSYDALLLRFGFLSVLMLIAAAIIKPAQLIRETRPPVCLLWRNVNSSPLNMRLGKGLAGLCPDCFWRTCERLRRGCGQMPWRKPTRSVQGGAVRPGHFPA